MPNFEHTIIILGEKFGKLPSEVLNEEWEWLELMIDRENYISEKAHDEVVNNKLRANTKNYMY